jgi:hypothetical protein
MSSGAIALDDVAVADWIQEVTLHLGDCSPVTLRNDVVLPVPLFEFQLENCLRAATASGGVKWWLRKRNVPQGSARAPGFHKSILFVCPLSRSGYKKRTVDNSRASKHILCAECGACARFKGVQAQGARMAIVVTAKHAPSFNIVKALETRGLPKPNIVLSTCTCVFICDDTIVANRIRQELQALLLDGVEISAEVQPQCIWVAWKFRNQHSHAQSSKRISHARMPLHSEHHCSSGATVEVTAAVPVSSNAVVLSEPHYEASAASPVHVQSSSPTCAAASAFNGYSDTPSAATCNKKRRVRSSCQVSPPSTDDADALYVDSLSLHGFNVPVLERVAADFLPFLSDKGMTHLKPNHGCQSCTSERLCQRHQALVLGVGNLDLTVRHSELLWASNRIFVECGGNGDCFYHSVMFLAELFLPHLARQWCNHETLRLANCRHLDTNYAIMRWPLEAFAGGAHGSIDFFDILLAKTSSRNRQPGAIVASFTRAHQRSARRGKNGTYVETEMLCAFAQFAKVPLLVTNYNVDGVLVYSPTGEPMHITDPAAARSPLHLWCTGGHYQALVPLDKVQLKRGAVQSDVYKLCHVVECKDVRSRPLQ